MSLRARVSFVKRVAAGDRISYGLRHTFSRSHDGRDVAARVRRRRAAPARARPAGEVLIGGRRRPIVGVVTMDQLMVDVGDAEVAVGDEAVLIGAAGRRADHGAEEWADRLGTIGYEIVCGISASGAAAPPPGVTTAEPYHALAMLQLRSTSVSTRRTRSQPPSPRT